MTNKGRLLSTICTALIVLFAGIMIVSTNAVRGNLIKVHATGNMSVAVSVEMTNAGRKVDIAGTNTLSSISSGSNLRVADQVFNGAGEKNAIKYLITLQNNEKSDISINFNELDYEALKENNLGAVYKYTIVTENNETESTKDTILMSGSKLMIEVSVFVLDGGKDANYDVNLTMNVAKA